MSESPIYYYTGENKSDVKFHYPPPMNPEEIAEYIHDEFTPYSQMSLEAAKKHLAELIERWADHYLRIKTVVVLSSDNINLKTLQDNEVLIRSEVI